MQEIYDTVQRDYPEGTKIVHAERVIRPGKRFGVFSEQRYEAVVSIPRVQRRPAKNDDPVRFDQQARTGIAALLAEADDDQLTPIRATQPPPLSTSGREFNDLLQDLVSEVGEQHITEQASAAPSPLAPGDLLVLVGLEDDALRAAPQVARSRGMLVACAGLVSASGAPRIDSPLEATEARAGGVRQNSATAVALGIDLHGKDLARLLRDIAPEQVWAVVDASRKPDDTEQWVSKLRGLADVAAVVVVGAELTSTPDTVNSLGLDVIELEDDIAA